MNKMENLIPVDVICANHNIEISFLRSLEETEMIEITTIEKNAYIQESQLHDLERIVHLYFDLDINLEGIDTIKHLLYRLNDMHNEIISLKNRLRLYETEY
jgi:hypothetical protein